MTASRVIAASFSLMVAMACQAGEQAQDQAPAKHAGKALYDSDDPSIVKKTRNNNCYDSSNGRFTEIVHYTAYRNMKDCLADGGKYPAH